MFRPRLLSPKVASREIKLVLCFRTVKEQSQIQSFDPLCEVQSDKASVEITSPYDGVVKQLLVNEGEVAKVGQGLCLIEVEEEGESTHAASTEATGPPESPVHGLADVGSAHRVTQTETYQPEPVTLPRKHPLDPANDAAHAVVHPDNVLATPSVRHFARECGVDLAAIGPGSGRDGRVERKDVEAFIARRSASEQLCPVPTPGEDVVVDLGRTRYGMWKAMIQVCRTRLKYFLEMIALCRLLRYPGSGALQNTWSYYYHDLTLSQIFHIT